MSKGLAVAAQLRTLCLAIVLFVLLSFPVGLCAAQPTVNPRVVVEFFYQPGCRECERTEQEILPIVSQHFEGFHELRRLDLGIATNLARLIQWQDKLGRTDGATVYVVVDGAFILSGYDAIAEHAIDTIDRAIAERAAGLRDDTAINLSAETVAQSPWRRSKGITLAGVIAGGLVDSINPCAIATLVFLISVLALSKESQRHIPIVGMAFCAGVYLTYAAMGFGLLRALHTLSSFHRIRHALDIVLLSVLALFSILSYRDAWRYQRTPSPDSISLKIPDALSRFIHEFIRTRLGRNARMSGAFLVGVVVTAIEAVCTSQTYAPVLAIVAANEPGFSTEVAYLLLYNLLFILPLLVILGLTWKGMPLARLLDWARGNVVPGKLLLGTFFATMAFAMFWLWR